MMANVISHWTLYVQVLAPAYPVIGPWGEHVALVAAAVVVVASTVVVTELVVVGSGNCGLQLCRTPVLIPLAEDWAPGSVVIHSEQALLFRLYR
jgi:hypothetical protein